MLLDKAGYSSPFLSVNVFQCWWPMLDPTAHLIHQCRHDFNHHHISLSTTRGSVNKDDNKAHATKLRRQQLKPSRSSKGTSRAITVNLQVPLNCKLLCSPTSTLLCDVHALFNIMSAATCAHSVLYWEILDPAQRNGKIPMGEMIFIFKRI